MTRAILPAIILVSAIMVAGFVTDPVEAQDHNLQVTVDPHTGSDGTTVNISGSGAPAGHEVVVMFSPWAFDQDCETPRGGDLVETVFADEYGRFSATHIAERFGDAHVGNTYLAFIPRVEAAEPMSNLECFEFDLTVRARHFDRNLHREAV